MRLMNLGFAAVTFAGLAVGVPAFADDMQQPVDTGQAPSGKMTMEKNSDVPAGDVRTAKITVTHVDKKTHMVRFEAQVKPEANLTKDGQPIRLDQLREGDQVQASFDPETGEVIKLEVIKAPMK